MVGNVILPTMADDTISQGDIGGLGSPVYIYGALTYILF